MANKSCVCPFDDKKVWEIHWKRQKVFNMRLLSPEQRDQVCNQLCIYFSDAAAAMNRLVPANQSYRFPMVSLAKYFGVQEQTGIAEPIFRERPIITLFVEIDGLALPGHVSTLVDNFSSYVTDPVDENSFLNH